MADIVLKDRQGENIVFSGVEKIKFLLNDGTQQIFRLVSIDEKGSIGKLAVAKGTFTPTSENGCEVTHNLRILPDIVLVWCQQDSNGYITSAEGLSDKMMQSLADCGNVTYLEADGVLTVLETETGHEESNASGFVNSATPFTFSVGGTEQLLNTASSYSWYAIGGLVDHDDYIFITLEADVENRKIYVKGGIPEIEKVNLYVDGELAKTSDYVHGDFAIDYPDEVNEFKEYEFSIEVVNALPDQYKHIYYEPTTGYGIASINGSCGDTATYTIDYKGNLVISGTGSMDDYASASEQPWYDYANFIKTVTIEDGITHVGQRAFQFLINTTDVSYGKSVENTGDRAFYNCTSLASVTIGNSVTTIENSTFYNCTSLASITIPDSVTTIGTYAFYGCTSLANITIPDSVTTIGNRAFYGCTSLASITIPDSVTTIEKSTFYNCTSLASVTIGNGVTTIGTYAFYGCTSLANITIPDSVTTIEDIAFYNCTSLASITIPDSVTTIGTYAFNTCTSLASVTIGNGVTTIGTYAFYNCTSLASAVFEDTTTWVYNISSTSTTGTTIASSSLANTSTAATYLKETYVTKYWHKV